MSSVVDKSVEPVEPSKEEMKLARESSEKLGKFFENGNGVLEMEIKEDSATEKLQLPKPAVELLYRLLIEMGRGNSVSLVPLEAELTTQEAADFLNVSRPHLVNLLEDGEIEFHKVGSHRRVKVMDLLQYKQQRTQEKESALNELVDQAQELELDYQ